MSTAFTEISVETRGERPREWDFGFRRPIAGEEGMTSRVFSGVSGPSVPSSIGVATLVLSVSVAQGVPIDLSDATPSVIGSEMLKVEGIATMGETTGRSSAGTRPQTASMCRPTET